MQNLFSSDVQLVFTNNSVDAAGSVLYCGVYIAANSLHGLDSYSSKQVLTCYSTLKKTPQHQAFPLIHFSCACPSLNGYSFCTSPYPPLNYPGETFQVPVVAVGQRYGLVPTTVRRALS